MSFSPTNSEFQFSIEAVREILGQANHHPWFARLAMPIGVIPDWEAARNLVSALSPPTLEDLDFAEYLEQAEGCFELPESDRELREALLLQKIQILLMEDLVLVRGALELGGDLIDVLEVGGLRVMTYYAGSSSRGEPDELCNRWLRLSNTPVLAAAGFDPRVS